MHYAAVSCHVKVGKLHHQDPSKLWKRFHCGRNYWWISDQLLVLVFPLQSAKPQTSSCPRLRMTHRVPAYVRVPLVRKSLLILRPMAHPLLSPTEVQRFAWHCRVCVSDHKNPFEKKRKHKEKSGWLEKNPLFNRLQWVWDLMCFSELRRLEWFNLTKSIRIRCHKD